MSIGKTTTNPHFDRKVKVWLVEVDRTFTMGFLNEIDAVAFARMCGVLKGYV